MFGKNLQEINTKYTKSKNINVSKKAQVQTYPTSNTAIANSFGTYIKKGGASVII